VIPRDIARHFPPHIRDRGDAYFANGAVRIVKSTADRIQALVRGTQQYVVESTLRRGTFSQSCTCPYASDSGPCKHIWATLRQLDADGSLKRLLRPNVSTSQSDKLGAEDARPPELHAELPAEFWEAIDAIDELDEFDESDDDGDLDEDEYLGDPDDDDDLHDPSALHDADPATLDALLDRQKNTQSTRAGRNAPNRPGAPAPIPDWKRALDRARHQMRHAPSPARDAGAATLPADRRLVYIADLDATWQSPGLVIDIGTERLAKSGEWSAPKRFGFAASAWFTAPDAVDRQIAEMLVGAWRSQQEGRVSTSGFVLAPHALPTTLRLICETGRCRTRSHRPELAGRTLRWDDGPPWRVVLRVQRSEAGTYALDGTFVRPDAQMAMSQPMLVHSAGFLVVDDAVARFEHDRTFPLISELRGTPSLALGSDPFDLLEQLYTLPHLPPLALPTDIMLTESRAEPVPILTIGADPAPWRRAGANAGLTLDFAYGPARVGDLAATVIFDRTSRIVHHRRRDLEDAARQRLRTLGARDEYSYITNRPVLVVPRARTMALASQLAREGWQVELDGAGFRVPGEIRASVRSGIDWFDVTGSVQYGDAEIALDVLLEARQRGEQMVPIADGIMGMMPTEWLARLGPLVATGERVDGATRFRKSQLSLLDALLATLPEVDVDETFARARTELAGFDRIEPADAPATFHGALRPYQREGLGWLHFLRRFALGGCLADDMGLGKTIQVLALLEARRAEGRGPSIVVVPRSLVFNWMREGERFVPALRMRDFSGIGRDVDAFDPTSVDVIITTYGTLRRDVANLAGITFDYAILDEAQAIKNAGTATAKACRLLRAEHRLALSGTPIENRIEELWSLLEFLNPGMLGASERFSSLARLAAAVPAVPGGAGVDDSSGRALLARALRPIILRRRKEEVAKELPARVEQTLEVELEPKQRKFYDALRAQYRQSVLGRVERDGLQKSRMHILEALLRLRQAACHPVLADRSKSALPSAKLDALLPLLQEVAAEGHKSLVFSQFTAFLALVRQRLDAEGVPYEYLDGGTRDRQARVDRFQSDAECPVFLISLKAGGHGLNLTEADYVYLLDPWWNPAVEAQAIDRAHRIGQRRRVMATRLVARDTIEEKILQLQDSKRALADAILTADKGVLASIGREELDELLG
jgi:superfamily II DNA or RNA helicase